MLLISNDTKLLCGITLITVPAIEFGGVFLLKMLRSREPGYMDNPLRQNLFRAGHAHAGVIVILSLICQVLVDAIYLPGPIAWMVRIGVPAAAIFIPLGFFLSVASPRAERPERRDSVGVRGRADPGDFGPDPGRGLGPRGPGRIALKIGVPPTPGGQL